MGRADGLVKRADGSTGYLCERRHEHALMTESVMCSADPTWRHRRERDPKVHPNGRLECLVCGSVTTDELGRCVEDTSAREWRARKGR